jgi:hypothetical protein
MNNLKGILKHGFFPRYCLEYTFDRADRAAAAEKRPPMRAAPLASFCDLPLSLIHKHLKEYGPFGIGLHKKWGIGNGVTPVLYTYAGARTRQPVLRLITRAAKTVDQTAVTDLELLAAYTKPFEGHAWRNNRVQRNVRFYDEREWRYVPDVRRDEKLFLNREDYDNTVKRNELQKRFEKHDALPIHPDDIQYLIVPYDKDENNILELHDYLMRLYARRYSRKDAILVTSAIMTDDCIRDDV